MYGCLRYPENCTSEVTCDMLITYKVTPGMNGYLDFTLTTKQSWIYMAFDKSSDLVSGILLVLEKHIFKGQRWKYTFTFYKHLHLMKKSIRKKFIFVQ